MRKKVIITLGILLTLVLAGWGWLHLKTYKPTEQARQVWQADVIKKSGYVIFQADKPLAHLILFGGGLVEEEAYAPLSKQLSDAGITVYLVQAPLNLPILASNKALSIIESENLEQVFLAGHSLGGVSFAQSVDQLYQNEQLAGIIFLASYPSEKNDLSKLDLPTLSITASKDQVLDWEKYQETKQLLPKKAEYFHIEGGNHSGFGAYGQQDGDGKPTINSSEQEDIVVNQIRAFIEKTNDQ